GATGVRPGAALTGDGAGDDEGVGRVTVELGAGVEGTAGDGAVGIDPDPALDDRTACAVAVDADETGVGATAQQQGQTCHDHRLPCPGLSGDDGQSRVELQDGFLDDAEPLETHLLEHRVTTLAVVTP